MTNISKSHKRSSELLNNPRFLSNPEEFLGPNYEAVLNFWMILDELTKDQWKTIWSRYWDFHELQLSEWNKAVDEARVASKETIGWEFVINVSYAAESVYNLAARCATQELIGMHLILKQKKPLTFFEMFLEVL